MFIRNRFHEFELHGLSDQTPHPKSEKFVEVWLLSLHFCNMNK